MTSNEILKANVLDIVFDNRNKNYGAYVLRKYYNNRLLIARVIYAPTSRVSASDSFPRPGRPAPE